MVTFLCTNLVGRGGSCRRLVAMGLLLSQVLPSPSYYCGAGRVRGIRGGSQVVLRWDSGHCGYYGCLHGLGRLRGLLVPTLSYFLWTFRSTLFRHRVFRRVLQSGLEGGRFFSKGFLLPATIRGALSLVSLFLPILQVFGHLLMLFLDYAVLRDLFMVVFRLLHQFCQ